MSALKRTAMRVWVSEWAFYVAIIACDSEGLWNMVIRRSWLQIFRSTRHKIAVIMGTNAKRTEEMLRTKETQTTRRFYSTLYQCPIQIDNDVDDGVKRHNILSKRNTRIDQTKTHTHTRWHFALSMRRSICIRCTQCFIGIAFFLPSPWKIYNISTKNHTSFFFNNCTLYSQIKSTSDRESGQERWRVRKSDTQ